MRDLFRVTLGLLIVSGCGKPAVEEVETTAAVPVSVEEAAVTTFEGALDVTGLVVPAPGGELTITAPQTARIVEIPKAEGEHVGAGDLLVRFDIPSLTADVAAKRAEVAQATAHVETATAAVTRLTSLVERGVAAQKDVEEARRERLDAEAAVAQAQSALNAAIALADRAVVRATFPGVVAKRWHNPGDLVEPGSADPVLRIIDPRRLQVLAAVPLADLPRVTVGRPARVVGPAGGDGVQATVLTRPGQVEPDRTTADVRVAFAAPADLPAGTPVEVHIVTESHPGAIVIPRAAVIREGDESFVMVAAENRAHRRAVTLGLAAGGRVEVRSGVAQGDLVIVRGQEGLPDGAAITVSK
jgi:RND family efflux transporter MFP subunit